MAIKGTLYSSYRNLEQVHLNLPLDPVLPLNLERDNRANLPPNPASCRHSLPQRHKRPLQAEVDSLTAVVLPEAVAVEGAVEVVVRPRCIRVSRRVCSGQLDHKVSRCRCRRVQSISQSIMPSSSIHAVPLLCDPRDVLPVCTIYSTLHYTHFFSHRTPPHPTVLAHTQSTAEPNVAAAASSRVSAH